MICGSCREAGRHNTNGDPFLAQMDHSICVNMDTASDTWCDCQHLVFDSFEVADDCPNCDGRKCMDCVLRIQHDECGESCPSCCPRAQIGGVLVCTPDEDWVDG